ncbi:HNH endonuclease [Archangium lansingense]|uniref:HNH endonuclease n=1 Tax=Archangium lansingense TaxID=2995310 RepID=UPI003B7AD11B
MLQCILLGIFTLLGSIEMHGAVPVPAQVRAATAPSCAPRILLAAADSGSPFAPVCSWQPLGMVETDGQGMSPAADAIAGKDRKSPLFTKKGKSIVKDNNAKKNDGKILCEECKVETVPGEKHVKDVTPPSNEAQVDHIIPKAKGGKGDPSNGQVLCRDCNIKKSDKTQ